MLLAKEKITGQDIQCECYWRKSKEPIYALAYNIQGFKRGQSIQAMSNLFDDSTARATGDSCIFK